MSMQKKFKRHKPAELLSVTREKTSTHTVETERYAYRPIKKAVDFDLEKQAIQQILDSVLRLQTYIAMREAREMGNGGRA